MPCTHGHGTPTRTGGGTAGSGVATAHAARAPVVQAHYPEACASGLADEMAEAPAMGDSDAEMSDCEGAASERVGRSWEHGEDGEGGQQRQQRQRGQGRQGQQGQDWRRGEQSEAEHEEVEEEEGEEEEVEEAEEDESGASQREARQDNKRHFERRNLERRLGQDDVVEYGYISELYTSPRFEKLASSFKHAMCMQILVFYKKMLCATFFRTQPKATFCPI